MEVLARKMKRGEKMGLKDYQYWVTYNFLVFPEKDQEKIKKINTHQQWFWRWMSLLIPPIWCGSFAIYKHQVKLNVVSNFFASTLTVIGLSKIGLTSSNREMKIYYNQLYDDYKDEVLSP